MSPQRVSADRSADLCADLSADLSAEARSATVDAPSAKLNRIDAAIDHVAARMVAMQDDAELSLRIVNALPDRTPPLRWWIPQLAAIGGIVLFAFMWAGRDPITSPSLLPAINTPIASALPPVAVEQKPGPAARRTVRTEAVERWRVGTVEPPGSDHDRSLAPIRALSALSVEAVSPSVIATAPFIELAPIEITELPMTADFAPRR